MTERAARNMALLCHALDDAEYPYFRSHESLTSYPTYGMEPMRRRPLSHALKLTATPKDTGILFEASLCVPLRAKNDEELRRIPLSIARRNCQMTNGTLVYRPSSGQLYSRLFYALTQSASEFSAQEVIACMTLCTSQLSSGYEFIIDSLKAPGPDEDASPDEGSLVGRACPSPILDRTFTSRSTDLPAFFPEDEADEDEVYEDEEDDDDEEEEEEEEVVDGADGRSFGEAILSFLSDILDRDDPSG